MEAFEQCSLKGFFSICISHQIYFSRRIANVGENCPCKILPCKLANCPTTTLFFNLRGGSTLHTPPTVTPLARKHHGEVKSTMVKLKALNEELTVIDEAGIEMFNASRLVISRNNYMKL